MTAILSKEQPKKWDEVADLELLRVHILVQHGVCDGTVYKNESAK